MRQQTKHIAKENEPLELQHFKRGGRLTLRYAHVRLLCTLLALLPTSFLAKANAGATVYKEVCSVCHGPTGEGTKSGPTQAPPLKGSAFVKSASPDELKSLIKFGRTGANKRFKDIPLG